MTHLHCLPSPDGCTRCQSARRGGENTVLLLGPQNANVRRTLVKTLTDAGLAFSEFDGTLTLDAPGGRLTSPALNALDALPEIALFDTRAALVSGDASCPGTLLTAFLRAESLSVLRTRARHDWVRDAIDDGWLFSVFHPIVETNTGHLFAYEALIRARHPETSEIIGAGPIIQACEHLQIEHVLDQRARQTAIRNAAALDVSADAFFFINFLPNTIYDPEICLRTTMETAAEAQISLSRLVFEVVETEHIPDMKRLRKILDYYRARGIKTAVDDMGAGHTSLKYLDALRPDFVKIDRDVLVKAEQSERARDEFESIVGKAQKMEIRVIAEGIETTAQQELCTAAGIDFMQGFLFARPANPPQSVFWPTQTLRKAA